MCQITVFPERRPSRLIWRHNRKNGAGVLLKDELNKRARWNRAELVQTGGAEGTDELHGGLRVGERSRTNGVQLPGEVAVQNGGGGGET